MWVKGTVGGTVRECRAVFCTPYELISAAHCRAWPVGTCLHIALFVSVIWHAGKPFYCFDLGLALIAKHLIQPKR